MIWPDFFETTAVIYFSDLKIIPQGSVPCAKVPTAFKSCFQNQASYDGWWSYAGDLSRTLNFSCVTAIGHEDCE